MKHKSQPHLELVLNCLSQTDVCEQQIMIEISLRFPWREGINTAKLSELSRTSQLWSPNGRPAAV